MRDPLRTFKATSKGCVVLSERMKPLRAALKQYEEAFMYLSRLRMKADREMNEGKVIKLPTCSPTTHKPKAPLSLDTINLISDVKDLDKLKLMIAQLEAKVKGAAK